MALNWPELLRTSPHELVVSGPKHSKQLEDEKGLNDIIFRIHTLNFMEVSKTSLDVLSTKIKELENLTALMLYDNKLEKLPKEIGLLRKLKTLDLSNNQLTSLPEEMSQLTELQSLNIVKNHITKLPKDLSKWSNLIVIKLGHNKLESFPKALCHPNLKQRLTDIHASDNQIKDIPIEISHLSSLKHLDLANNKIEFVPGELADCVKLKTFALQGNPINDVRLHKLAENNPTKQIMQYIAKSCKRGGVVDTGKGPKGRNRKVSTSSKSQEDKAQEGSPTSSPSAESEQVVT